MPKLLAVKNRLIDLKHELNSVSDYVFTTQSGQPYTYSGAATAWKRAVKRSKIQGVTFHDIRAKALTDTDETDGIIAAQHMGGHTTQDQTKDYIRQYKPREIKATR